MLNRSDKKKGGKDIGTQMQNIVFVTQLLLSLQSLPDANIADFFRFGNQREPPRLADQGSLRIGTKSDIFQRFNVPNWSAGAAKHAAVVVLDMAAVIHMVRSTIAKTFNDSVQLYIEPYLQAQIHMIPNASTLYGINRRLLRVVTFVTLLKMTFYPLLS